ncbi:MAG: peptide deformylase [Candidatus Pacebacteria bacterium]|jgi:peptide deformylase|nr:peptide deformylase [Candidatus Paceibacterota bacterium]
MVKILQMGEPILRTICAPVDLDNIPKTLFKDLKEAVFSQSDGVAIAAPQIGSPLRVFYIAGSVLKKAEPDKHDKEKDDMYFINPVIVKKSRETQVLEEGCLSIRYLYGKVRRPKKITIRAYDENGVLFERGASGLLAQIIQHENDHLDGVLFIDKAVDVEEILPDEHNA